MIYFFIVVVVGLLIGILTAFDDYEFEGFGVFVWRPIVGLLLGGLIGIMASLVIGGFMGLFLPQIAVVDKHIDLAALQDNTGISGSFFLGSGSIDSKPVYYYLQRFDNGGFTQESINADEVIMFQDTQEPFMVTYTSNFKWGDWLTWWALPLKSYKTEVHIPPNSILRNYKVDLQ